MDHGGGDSRRHARSNLSLKVEYPDLASFLHDYTENISRGGTFVSSERTWTVGDSLRLSLSFPGLVEPIELGARVAWVRTGEGRGVGLEFQPDEHREAMERLASLVEAIERGERAKAARRVRVLVVEDNPLIAGLLEQGLARLSLRRKASPVVFSFSRAGDGATALELVDKEPFDVVLADIYLPVLGGAAFIRRCRDLLGPGIPIIALSAGGEEAQKVALAAGADLFLDKPLRLVNVFETMAELLGLDGAST